MQPFEWTEDCSVDIPQLDAQHRHIIELLAELRKCADIGESAALVPTALDRMVKYAESHLEREEFVLRIRNYPGYAEHKTEHDAYRKKLASLQAQSGRADSGVRITNFLAQWWKFHIQTSDQQYARFFRLQQK